MFEGEEFTKWRGLREYVHARWLGLVFNRVLLRPAYGEEGMQVRKFDYVERVVDGDVDLHLWGNAVWSVTSLATRSFARIGWCTDIMGQRASGMIEDLPIRRYERPGAEEVSFPLETAVGDIVERDLSKAGIMALTAALNSDRAFLRFAPSVHTPGHYQDPMDLARARLQSTLPYQLFVSRVINYAMLIEGRVVPGRSAEQVSAGYDQALRGLMASAGAVPEDAVQVGVVPNADDPSQQVLHMRITWPGFKSLPDAGRLELTWPIQG
jgi:type VI secretion system protein ImpC